MTLCKGNFLRSHLPYQANSAYQVQRRSSTRCCMPLQRPALSCPGACRGCRWVAGGGAPLRGVAEEHEEVLFFGSPRSCAGASGHAPTWRKVAAHKSGRSMAAQAPTAPGIRIDGEGRSKEHGRSAGVRKWRRRIGSGHRVIWNGHRASRERKRSGVRTQGWGK
jgi:hypothetical protein